jgi:transposase-like protein
MQSPVPAARVAQAAQISASVERYLSAGGEIQRIAIGKSALYDPLRAASRPTHEQKKAENYKASMATTRAARRSPPKPSRIQLWRAKWTDTVLAMFDAGTTIKQIEADTGQSRYLISACVADSGRDTATNRYRPASHEQIEQIRTMAADRYSGRYTAVVMGLERERVYTIAKKHGIEFVSRDRKLA